MSKVVLLAAVELDDTKLDALRDWYRGLTVNPLEPAGDLAAGFLRNAVEKEMDVEDVAAIAAMAAITDVRITYIQTF